MVLYGIKVNKRISIYYTNFFDFISVGEANGVYNRDKYNCTFSQNDSILETNME